MPDIGFFETMGSAGALPLSEIKRIGDEHENKHGVTLRTIHMKDGPSFETFSAENGGLLRRPVQIIPAEPGTCVIRVDDWGDYPPRADRSRVVAWALCLDGVIRPVTPNGVNDSLAEPIYVELADGSIEAVDEWADPCAFTDAAAMVHHFASKPFDEAEAELLAARAAYDAHSVSFEDEETDPENNRLRKVMSDATACFEAIEPRTPEQAIRQIATAYLDGASEVEVPSAKIVHLAKLLDVSL